MNHRKDKPIFWSVTLLVFGLLVLCVAKVSSGKQPMSRDMMPLSHWIRELQKPGGNSQEVLNAFRGMNPDDTVPVLVRLLTRHDSSLETLYRTIWLRSPALLTKALPHPLDTAVVRANAACALKEMGSSAALATPQLLSALKDESGLVRTYAAHALAQIAPEANLPIEELVRALNDNEMGVRYYTCVALAKMRKEASTATNALLTTLSDPDELVRWQAAHALNSIGAVFPTNAGGP